MERKTKSLFAVYRYYRNSDGSIELLDRQTFHKQDEAEFFFSEVKDNMLSGLFPVGALELNREIYYDNDFLMHDSVMIDRFDNESVFAAN